MSKSSTIAKPDLMTWPSRSVEVGRQAGPTFDATDHDEIRSRIENLSKDLFKQDGTVEALACRWSEQGTYYIHFLIQSLIST